MKTRNIVLAVISLLVLAGCASAPETADADVYLGMSRNRLRARFGEPLRIVPVASGGEDWYYRFVSWKAHGTAEAGTSVDFGERTSSVSMSIDPSKGTEEHAIHVSSDGYVMAPLPEGKVVRQ